MATIVTRAGKGSPLTNNEVDSNFTNLNTAKFEKSGDTADYLTLNTAAAATTAVARVRWNTATGTGALGLVGGNVEANLGQQLYAYVTNAEAVQINKGQPVYLFGAQGDRATVKLAFNTSDATSAKTLGLAAENIAAGQTGFVICQGVLNGVDTSAFTPGDTLYLGATAGTLTSTKPVAPNHLVYLGVVERANVGGGEIYVRTQNGYELDELHDVLITSKANGDVLMYNSTSGLWENEPQSAINAGTVTNGVYTTGNQTIGGVKTFSSTIVGSINGNAATVTNGVVTTGSYADPSWITSLSGTKLTGTVVATNGVVTTGTYANPSWITSLDGGKLTGTVVATNGVVTTGSYANPSWITSLAEAKVLPSQTGNSGRYLTTNGTSTSWANVPAPNNGTLTMNVSGTGLSGSATFTADQAGASTFTVTSNATSANTASTIVARDASGNFSAGTITATLSGNATNVSGTVAIANGGTGATTAANALTNLGAYPASNPSGYTSNTGTVTSVSGTGSYGGLTLSGTVTTSGSLTLGGTPTGTWPISVSGSAASATTATNQSGGTVSATTITSTTTNSTSSITITDTGTSGANLRLSGNGATTPNKSIRAFNGNLSVVNSAYTQEILILTDAGNLTAVGDITSSSDERLKDNWADLPSDFVERLAQVKSGTYDRKDIEKRQVGVGAQSLQALMPEAVNADAEGMLSVAYGQAALAAAVELAKQVVELKKEIAELKGKL